ncbi:hypothetical protein QRX60_21785 [Amycolatopsis mongoliensis]|uniref:Lectin-like protein BA14k n=1 Tax=Amycolatopsis mongoliensis TaxID=715475 RepID=A0A9Y2NIF7_9PSEU|nr:hypothetical protein [Amycolatopsis sp. 4-36]WIY06347.1 hypothetical protein QRX60_21785 [Amycolatopsis sp. 4-36]
MRPFRATAAVSAVLALAACGTPVAGHAVPAGIQTVVTTAPATPTVTVPPPPTRTVVVPTTAVAPPRADVPASSQWYAQPSWIHAQPWITITPAAGQTPCQWLYSSGYTYAQAFAAWAQNGYPASWSATGDGYPCQKSYGMQH